MQTKRLSSSEPSSSELSSSKKHKAAQDHSSLQSLRITSSNPVLDLSDGQTLQISGPYRRDNYELSRRRMLAATAHASLSTTDYSLRPGQIVVTKVLQGKHTSTRWVQELAAHTAAGNHVSEPFCKDNSTECQRFKGSFVNFSPSLALYAFLAVMLVFSPFTWSTLRVNLLLKTPTLQACAPANQPPSLFTLILRLH